MTKNNGYVDSFNNLMSIMRSSKKLKVIGVTKSVQEAVSYDSKLWSINFIKEKTGCKLNEDFFPGFDVGGFHLNWSYKIGDKKGGGEFSLNSLLEIFLGEDMELGSESDPGDIKLIKDQFRVFDEHPETGDDQFAAFRLEGKKVPPEIWYWNRGVVFKMNIPYSGYLDALLDLKGINNWHFLFVDDLHSAYHRNYYDKTQYTHIADGLGKKISDLEFLFPDVSYDSYHKLLSAFRKKI